MIADCDHFFHPLVKRMSKISYSGYRFPPEIIHRAIWLYLLFTLSLRDVEDLLSERGIAVSYETIRRWMNHFGPMIATAFQRPTRSPQIPIARIRRTSRFISRGFLPWRFSDTGPRHARHQQSLGRYPKTFT